MGFPKEEEEEEDEKHLAKDGKTLQLVNALMEKITTPRLLSRKTVEREVKIQSYPVSVLMRRSGLNLQRAVEVEKGEIKILLKNPKSLQSPKSPQKKRPQNQYFKILVFPNQ